MLGGGFVVIVDLLDLDLFFVMIGTIVLVVVVIGSMGVALCG